MPALRSPGVVGTVRNLLLVVAASLVLGGLTSVAQLLLPDVLRSLANSASGWTLLTGVLVWLLRTTTWRAAVAGAASFVALVLGYQVVSGLRGYPTSETLFLVVGVVVGPFVGVAAAWLRRGGVLAALGVGVLAGIGLGEGVYGLLVVSGTTGWAYWTLIAVLAAALLAAVCVRVLRGPRPVSAAIGLTALVAAAFFVAYRSLG